VHIDISSLTLGGTYVLKLTPGTGHNVLRGDVDLVTTPQAGNPEVQAFAVPANVVTGDTITFVAGPFCCCPDSLEVVSAVSRKTHGTAGAFDRPSGTIEGRSGGVTKVVTTFDNEIQRVTNSSSDVSISSGTVGAITVEGKVLTVNVSGVTDKALFTISYPGIVVACFNIITDVSTDTVNCWKVLSGDVNGTSPVNSLDLLAIRGGGIEQIVFPTNFAGDLNASGRIDSLDLLACRSKLNNAVTGTCP
jgi:hypothetical protein